MYDPWFCKQTYPFSGLSLIAGTVVFAPVALLTWDIESAALPYLAASAALEIVYFALLAGAYERGELSMIYPVARGSAQTGGV